MAIKDNHEIAQLFAKVLSQYGKTGKVEEKCPYCSSPISVIQNGTLTIIQCETEGCLKDTIHGI